MIVITKIEYLETDRDIYQLQSIASKSQLIELNTHNEKERMQAKLFIETIQGQCFRRPSDGTDIYIGNSRQAEKVIGIQYEAWQSNHMLVKDLSYQKEALKTELSIKDNYLKESNNKIEQSINSDFWTRFKWLIGGYK